MENLQEVLDKIEINTRSTAKSSRETADWDMFNGIITIVGLVAVIGATAFSILH